MLVEWEESWERLRALRDVVVLAEVGHEVLVVLVEVEGLFDGASCSVCSVFRSSCCEMFRHDWSSLSRSFQVSVLFFTRLNTRRVSHRREGQFASCRGHG